MLSHYKTLKLITILSNFFKKRCLRIVESGRRVARKRHRRFQLFSWRYGLASDGLSLIWLRWLSAFLDVPCEWACDQSAANEAFRSGHWLQLDRLVTLVSLRTLATLVLTDVKLARNNGATVLEWVMRSFNDRIGDNLPNRPIVELYSALWETAKYDLILLSGRSEDFRLITKQWLVWNKISFSQLLKSHQAIFALASKSRKTCSIRFEVMAGTFSLQWMIGNLLSICGLKMVLPVFSVTSMISDGIRSTSLAVEPFWVLSEHPLQHCWTFHVAL